MSGIRLAVDLTLPVDAATGTFGILATKILAAPRDVQIAWVAGIFEGEGCISNDRMKRGMRRQLSVVNTDRDILDALLAVTGRGRIEQRKWDGNPLHKAQWRWVVGAWADVHAVLSELLPYLSPRRVEKAMELLADPPVRGVGRCREDHPLTGPDADVYTSSRSTPQCAICARRRARAYREATS